MLEGESQRRLGCLDYKRFDIDARGRHGPAGNASYAKRPLRASRPIVANAEHLEWGDGDACPDDADTCLSIPGQVKWLRWHEPSVTN
jgi:hypothetical protein